MALNVAAGAPGIFLSIPYVNKDSDTAAQIVATSMQSLVHRIYQLDPTAYWQGSLGADDTKTERIVMGIYKGSVQAAVSLDSFIILNNNLNNFVLEYCTNFTPGVGGAAGTGTWQNIATVTGNAGADYVKFLVTPIASINGLRLTMTTTTPANAQKIVGNFIAALSKFPLTNPFSSMKTTPVQRRIDLQLADGTIDSTYLFWSDNSFTLNTLDLLVDYVDPSGSAGLDKSNLDSLLTAAAPFLFYPEPGDVVRNIYLGLFDPSSYQFEYYPGEWKGAGRKIPFKFRQIGYL